MNGWALGGILCVIYAVVVSGLAYAKVEGLLKIVKMKLGKKDMSDKGAQIACYIISALVLAFGIFCFIKA